MRTQNLQSVISRCKVVVWHYEKGTVVDDTNKDIQDYQVSVFDSSKLDDNNQFSDSLVTEFNYTKSGSGNPGEFTLMFAPNFSVMSHMAPGDWVAVYLSQEGTNEWSLRCLGNINRVGRVDIASPNGGTLISRYEVHGFDYGKVFFTTTIFFNQQFFEGIYFLILIEQIIKQAGAGGLVQTAGVWVDGFLRLFLGPATGFVPLSRLTEQWHIPYELLQLFGISTDSPTAPVTQTALGLPSTVKDLSSPMANLFDQLGLTTVANTALSNLQNMFNTSKTGLPTSKASSLNLFYNILRFRRSQELDAAKASIQFPSIVDMWSLLMSYSHPQINQLFYEIDDSAGVGNEVPALYLRMYPYAFKKYTDIAGHIPDSSIVKFLDIPEVKIDPNVITNSNIGVSDHERLNMFFIYGTNDNVNGSQTSANWLKGKGVDQACTITSSIKKFGTRLDTDQSEFLLFKKNNGPNYDLTESVNFLRRHWFENNHNFMSGNVMMVGDPGIRLGKRLVINPDGNIHNFERHFYIAQYTDNWTFPGVWRQSVALNRGVYVIDGEEKFYNDDVDGIAIGTAGASTVRGIKR